jgi:hypothetical protein
MWDGRFGVFELDADRSLCLLILFSLGVRFDSRRLLTSGGLPVDPFPDARLFLDVGPVFAALGPPSAQQFHTTFELPASFVDDLRLAIPHFPVHPESGRQQVMFTGFDVQPFELPRTCSA